MQCKRRIGFTCKEEAIDGEFCKDCLVEYVGKMERWYYTGVFFSDSMERVQELVDKNREKLNIIGSMTREREE